MEITVEMVKELRTQTGIAMMECKKALTEAQGDIEKAKIVLRKNGLDNGNLRIERIAKAGVVYNYSHGLKIGVMVELNCETDFVARTEEFQSLAKVIAMHVAWANPKYLRVTDIPKEELQVENDIIMSQIKPEQQKFLKNILPGKLSKFYKKVCLMEQDEIQVSEGKKTITDLIHEFSRKCGENIVLKRFARFSVGEGDEEKTV